MRLTEQVIVNICCTNIINFHQMHGAYSKVRDLYCRMSVGLRAIPNEDVHCCLRPFYVNLRITRKRQLPLPSKSLSNYPFMSSVLYNLMVYILCSLISYLNILTVSKSFSFQDTILSYTLFFVCVLKYFKVQVFNPFSPQTFPTLDKSFVLYFKRQVKFCCSVGSASD